MNETPKISVNPEVRLNSIPVLYVRGTHYMLGYTIGRTFKGMISELLESWSYVDNVLVAQYLTEDGKLLYENCLSHCQNKFPQYIKEIEGTAAGAQIPFYKLFLLNIESIMATKCRNAEHVDHAGKGCTSIMCNKDELLLGHSEDADKEILNNVYIVSAEVLDEESRIIEQFTSFSYAGHLAGYTMGYNDKGMVHSVNTIFPTVYESGTPRNFIARALLSASTLEETLDILRDTGTGISDGFSLNVYFHNKPEGPKFYNIEVGPPNSEANSESQLDVLPIGTGHTNVHSNKYCRIKRAELCNAVSCSTQRQDTIAKYPSPDCIQTIKDILSDQSQNEYPIFIGEGMTTKINHIKTVAVGIFNITDKTWSVFLDPPATSKPVAVIKMNF